MNETQRKLLEALRPEPRTRAELARAAGLERTSPRAVQRAPRLLVESGRATARGLTRDRTYSRGRPAEEPGGDPGRAEVPLSFEARQCLRAVEQPLSARTPVTYQRELLDQYHPGETWWLGPQVRARLAAVGRTPALEEPAGTWARKVLERFLLDLSWNSSRLEGNTYSLLDTEKLLARGEAAEGKDVRETRMLLNHKAAIEYLVADPLEAELEPRTVKTLHALLMEGLMADRMDEGRLRQLPVGIGASAFIPLSNPQLIEECFRQVLHTAARIPDPFEASLFLLAHLPYLQPFLDGNKRTARLAANLPFVLGNRPPLSFADVPRDLLLKAHLAVYELGRVELLRDVFTWAYERSAARLGPVQRSVGEPDPVRLRYRALLHEVVREVVRANPPEERIPAVLEASTQRRVAASEHARFLAMAELELEALHDGNFGRYGLRPSEFEAWEMVRMELGKT